MAELAYSKYAITCRHSHVTLNDYLTNAACRILTSKPFQFFVGPDRTEFTLHSAVVASQSRALNALVNGSMKEAAERATTWENVDEQTFIRFGQYVYTGDYEGEAPLRPEPVLKEGETLKEEEAPAKNDDWDSLFTSKKDKKKKAIFGAQLVERLTTKREEACYKFENERLYNCGVAGIHFSGKNRDCRVEYGQVFLSHARLHMLAEYYGMEQLAQLTLHKLHRILCNFELHIERVQDVVDLLRFCFEEDERAKLRELVAMYAVCQFEKLWADVEFRRLLTEHTKLSMAVLGLMVMVRLD